MKSVSVIDLSQANLKPVISMKELIGRGRVTVFYFGTNTEPSLVYMVNESRNHPASQIQASSMACQSLPRVYRVTKIFLRYCGVQCSIRCKFASKNKNISNIFSQYLKFVLCEYVSSLTVCNDLSTTFYLRMFTMFVYNCKYFSILSAI